MNEMIKRVADAIEKKECEFDPRGMSWTDEEIFEIARAAIAAIGELLDHDICDCQIRDALEAKMPTQEPWKAPTDS